MILEWGNDKFINNKGEYQQTGNTIIEDLWFNENNYTQLAMIDTIERYRDTMMVIMMVFWKSS